MVMLIRTTCSFAMLTIFMTCGQRPAVPETNATRVPTPPPFEEPKFRPTDVRAIVDSIPPSASREQMDRGLELYLSAFSKARSGEVPEFLAALSVLKDQPQLVASFAAHYERLPKTNHGQRMLTLGTLGELQRPDAMPFLNKTIWTQLPKRQRVTEGPTPRDLEEMVLVKAVHGLGYLANPEADRALIDVMQRHESRAVKISAIDSYMWNHRDTNEAAQFLYGILPRELHKFVQQPRFYRGMDQQRFNEEVKAWQSKWGSPQHP